jgi:hypothetical protein
VQDPSDESGDHQVVKTVDKYSKSPQRFRPVE